MICVSVSIKQCSQRQPMVGKHRQVTGGVIFQRIYQADGTSRDRLAGEFVYHAGHGHIHFEGFAKYELVLTDGSGNPIGHLDGLEPIGAGRFLVTDWVEGGLLLVNRFGASRVVADLESGSAGLGLIPALGQIVVPMTGRGTLVAFQVE